MDWRSLGQAKCAAASFNILTLNGGLYPYNICRNLEWQLCAAQGKLLNQHGVTKFAQPPNTLDPSGQTSGRPLGKCNGHVPDDDEPHGYVRQHMPPPVCGS